MAEGSRTKQGGSEVQKVSGVQKQKSRSSKQIWSSAVVVGYLQERN